MGIRDLFLAFLILASIGTSLIVAYYKYASKKGNKYVPSGYTDSILEFSRSTYIMFVFFALLHLFILEKFVVPTGSMIPSLLVGDYVLVNKYHYGVTLPFVNKTIYKNNAIKRGDIIVFQDPYLVTAPEKSRDMVFIKRVIGVPGDKIRYKNKTVYINDEPLNKTFLERVEGKFNNLKFPVRKFEEEIDGSKHLIQLNYGIDSEMTDIVVPEDFYFCLGDNRDNSKDSRYMGLIHRDLVVGRASFLFFSWDTDSFSPRWNRIGQRL